VSLSLVHAAAGTVLLALGVLAALSPKRRRRSPHRRFGQAYVLLLIVVLPTGMVIGAHDPALSLFELATPPTLLLGLAGWSAGRARPRRWWGQPWRTWHIAGMGGSLIGVITATAFQVVPRLVEITPVIAMALWSVPTIVGSVLIARATRRWTGDRAQRRADDAEPAAA
jgi:peptidoglycan/LPS O-acetylase OafA/YrhL